MKKVIAISILVFLIKISFGQDTIILSLSDTNYFQFDSNKSIDLKDSLKDGYYILMGTNQTVLIKANYYNKRRQGLYYYKDQNGEYERFSVYVKGLRMGIEVEKLKLKGKWKYNINNHGIGEGFEDPFPQVEW